MRNYLHLPNAHFLFGGLTSAGLRVLEDGLAAWDAESGIPSRIIRHSQMFSKPPTFSNAVAGLVSEEGKGTRFVVTKGQDGRAPELQVWLVGSRQGWQEVIGVPMRYALKGSRNLTRGYTVYLHSIVRQDGTDLNYYGITSRHWLERLKEHVVSANSGSLLLFHRALRDALGKAARFQHTIIVAGLTKDEAYDAEEYLIDKYSLAPNFENGLNMVPGGYEGLRQLHEMGLLREGKVIEPEEQEALLERYTREHPRLGIPNPLVSERWKDDAYAEAVICGRENRLTAQQVRYIRMLSILGHTIDDITILSGASNGSQVRRVIENRSYARIR
jgi:hypothetical protein